MTSMIDDWIDGDGFFFVIQNEILYPKIYFIYSIQLETTANFKLETYILLRLASASINLPHPTAEHSTHS